MLRISAALVVVLLASVAACGGSVPSSDPTTTAGGPGTPAPSPVVPSEPIVSGSPAETEAPSAPESPGATAAPLPTTEPLPTTAPLPTAEPGDPGEPLPSGELTGAEACSGSDDNRGFFADFAKAVEWPVLCGVLPRGWFVAEGSYRLANGGKLLVRYRGPGGASIALSQGAFCGADDGCVPTGTNLGSAPLGPLDGTLHQTGDDYAISATAGANLTWLMTTKGLDRATSEALAAALAEVGR